MHVCPWWPCPAAAGLAINYLSSGLARIPVFARGLAGYEIQLGSIFSSHCVIGRPAGCAPPSSTRNHRDLALMAEITRFDRAGSERWTERNTHIVPIPDTRPGLGGGLSSVDNA